MKLIVSAIDVIAWLISLLVLVIVSVKTIDNAGFSMYQILLILDIMFGLKMITQFFIENKDST